MSTKPVTLEYYKDNKNIIYKIKNKIENKIENKNNMFAFEQIDENGKMDDLGGELNITNFTKLTEEQYKNEEKERKQKKESFESGPEEGGGAQKKTQKIQAKTQPKEASHKKKFQKIKSRFLI
jgi:inactivated superfamily I helicase